MLVSCLSGGLSVVGSSSLREFLRFVLRLFSFENTEEDTRALHSADNEWNFLCRSTHLLLRIKYLLDHFLNNFRPLLTHLFVLKSILKPIWSIFVDFRVFVHLLFVFYLFWIISLLGQFFVLNQDYLIFCLLFPRFLSHFNPILFQLLR